MPRIAVCLALLSAVGCLSILCGQTAPVPDDRAMLLAFDSFFRDIDQSQKSVASRSVTPARAREHFQNAYDMEPAILDEVIKAAVSYIPEVAVLDAEAAAIIRAAKEKSPASGPSRAAVPPPRLVELQKSKETLIRQTLWSIESAIGPAQLRSCRCTRGG
jgi:hypothetical protein